MKICVFGASSYAIDKEYMEKVEKLSQRLAKDGHGLVFGAGQNGLMGASARGFKKENAHICGVIPEFFKDMGAEIIYEECDELIFTETMAQRKTLMEDKADAFIVVPGGIGTFEELFEILTLKQLKRHNKAIIIYNINDYYKEFSKLMEVAIEKEFVNEKCKDLYFITSDEDEIFEYLMNYKPEELDIKELKKG